MKERTVEIIPARSAEALDQVFRRSFPTILRTAPPPGVAVVVGGVGVHQICHVRSQFDDFLDGNQKLPKLKQVMRWKVCFVFLCVILCDPVCVLVAPGSCVS